MTLFLIGCSHSENSLSPVRSPEDELKTIVISPGLKLQLVASEPMIEDPVVMTWDGNGRLWVVEMRGFMPDIDGKGENKKIGRVSVLTDKDGDGTMDESSVFLDSLVLPRAIALVKGGALIAESRALWFAPDANGDLKADSKILVDSTYADGPSPEHSGNGLLLGIDNWYYNARSHFRYRLIEGKWKKDSTEVRGQWGISHDDAGRLFYNYNWSQLHADLVPPNYFSGNKNHVPTTGIDHGLTLDRRVYPIRATPAVNRGYIPGTLNAKGKLVEFTAACSPFVFRGQGLPAEYYGNAFVCEPSGNLVKRNVVTSNGIDVAAHDASPGTEFMASTDERFRPVFLSSGPDGALYVADMYRGLIQHGSYVTPYLREKTLERKLVKPTDCGRIWRIVSADHDAKKITLKGKSNLELVASLKSDNGWERDLAQQLIVESGDTSVTSALVEIAANSKNELARLHALWTMEGLSVSDSELLINLLFAKSPLVRSNVVRILEPMVKKDLSLRKEFQSVVMNEVLPVAPHAQALQLALTARVLDLDASLELLMTISDRYDSSALFRDAVLSSLSSRELAFLKKCWVHAGWNTDTPSREILLEMLATAVIKSRDPVMIGSMLAMLKGNDAEAEWKEKVLLAALAVQGKNTRIKPVALRTAPAQPALLADVKSPYYILNSLFSWPGHAADTTVSKKKNILNEKEQQQFVLGRQLYLTTCSACHGADGGGLNRFAPPLDRSEWVNGSDKRLALLVLHGLEGPIDVDGKHFDAPNILPVMPAHSTMDDASISAILTYVRNAWSNSGTAVNGRFVSITRIVSQGRVVPWTVPELNKHMLDTTTYLKPKKM